jgi:peptide/nickel transport system permease protein
MVLLDSLLQGRFDAFVDALRHIILPAVTLSTVPMAVIVRITRNSMLEVLGMEYIRAARAKGLPADTVVMTHAFRNAMVPIVTILGLEFGYLLGGAVLTETIFDWPGMGRYLVEAVFNKDQNSVMGAATVIVTVFVLMNTLVDIAYAWIDPRVRYG